MMAPTPLQGLRFSPRIVYVLAALLMLAGIGIIYQAEADYRRQVAADTRTKAEILAASVVAALDFDDALAAQDAVDALVVDRRIRAVRVDDADVGRIASFDRMNSGAAIEADLTTSTAPVTNRGQRLGAVSVSAELHPLSRRISRYATIGLLLAFAALLVAVIGLAQAAQRRANIALRKTADELLEANDALTIEMIERERAEAARRESDALYRGYYENTSEALFIVEVTEDGRLVYLGTNPACGESSGFTNTLAAGKEPRELFDGPVAAQLEANYRRCVETGEVQHYTETLPMPLGVRHFETVLVPIRTRGGRIDRVMGSGRDITERLQLQDALRQAQKMEALGQLTGGVAHDFNNLLMAASSGFELMERARTEERREALKAAIRDALDRGARLTQQLLAFSRRTPMQTEVVELSGQIDKLASLLEHALGETISVRFEIPADLWPVEIDVSQFDVAVLNIALNARDAMPKGGEIQISAKNVADALEGKDAVEIAIRDEGGGMSPEAVERGFEPFYTTKEAGRGTGLGLSQVYGFAHAAGGQVALASELGAGTTVTLRLPASRGGDVPRTNALPLAAQPAELAGVQILLVEDDPDLNRLVGQMLEELGAEVTRCSSAEEGRRKYEEHRVDAVLTDMVMPGEMDGFEFARGLREDRRELPIVLMTGFSAVAGAALKEGFTVLRKPFTMQTLASALGQALPDQPRTPQ